MTPLFGTVALVAHGQSADLAFLRRRLSSFETVVAVDGGLGACVACGVAPHLIIGDFDSASDGDLAKFPTVAKIAATDPDKTDLEKALEHVFSSRVDRVVVFCALGKRIDHTLTNICLLSRWPSQVTFETETEVLFVTGRQTELAVKAGQTISLVPLNGPVIDVTSKGLKWELERTTLSKEFVGISNVATSERLVIGHEGGDLLVCLNRGEVM